MHGKQDFPLSRDYLRNAVFTTLLLTALPFTRSPLLLFPGFEGLSTFAAAEMAAALVAALIVLLRERNGERHPLPDAVAIGALGLNVVGSLALPAGSALTLPSTLAGLGGLLCGAAAIPILCRCASLLARKTLGENMIAASAILGAASAMFWFASLLPVAVRTALWFACLALGTAGLVRAFRTTGFFEPSKRGQRAPIALGKLTSLVGVPLIGVLIYGTFAKAGVVPYEARPTVGGLDEELLFFVVAALALAAVGFSSPKRSLYASIYQVVAPLFACVILFCISFPIGAPVHEVGNYLIVFSTSFVLLFAVAVAGTLIGTGETSPTLAVNLVVGAYATGRIAGLVMHGVVGAGPIAYAIYQVLLTTMLAAMLLLAAFQGRHRSTGTSLDGPKSIREKIDLTCAALRERHSLSARETEVLELLGRGHSPAFVAQELVISESTARTHVNRIYRKLGVSSREELLTLIDETEQTLAES